MKNLSDLKMDIKECTRLLRKAVLIVALPVAASLVPVEAGAQNVINKLLGSEKVESNRRAGENSKKKKQKESKQKKQKQQEALPDATEMSLDENVRVPEIPLKQKERVKAHMNSLAKRLARPKTAKIETMRDGEVVVATIGTDLLFAPNDTSLMSRGKDLLKPYADLITGNPGLYKILIVVHTDDTGSDEYTDWLSEARVEAVYQALVPSVESAVVVPYALGATEPRVPNTSMDNRSANRRLEIFIVPDGKLIGLAKSNKLKTE